MEGDFHAASQAITTSSVMPCSIALSDAQGLGLLTFLCTSGIPELEILGNSILILVSNWKNHGVLINFICTFVKK
jgi:hypothetical protein